MNNPNVLDMDAPEYAVLDDPKPKRFWRVTTGSSANPEHRIFEFVTEEAAWDQFDMEMAACYWPKFSKLEYVEHGKAELLWQVPLGNATV